MKISSAARNILIILLLAAAVAFLPGGGTAASVVLTALYLAFLGSVGWVGAIVYRERRGSLYLLGDGRRGLLYGAIVVIVVTLTATSRLWSSSAGQVAWLILLGAAIYALFAILWAARRY